MSDRTPKIITILAKPELARQNTPQRQLRVAAYCRVSTGDEEQLSSYEAQRAYYTDKIMTTPQWTMAGIFADEGITGTSATKRPDFLRMIRLCKQKKIDVILVKSISRFARNTVDCLKYIWILKAQGIAVIFEKENINTMESDSEMIITMMGAFAQAESESISANVRWGKRQAMREGKVTLQYSNLYAYQKGQDGRPESIQEQAEVVWEMYRRYLAGASLRMLKEWLEANEIRTVDGKSGWTPSAICGILMNEKYCGDVLLQKTFISDCINRKVVRNTGQLPMYLIQNHHEAIVDRATYDAVQAEMARRNAGRSPSKKSLTDRSSYTSKYALSERLVCRECGTLYRRCTWAKNGRKRIVWRCVSRLDYGTKYCHNSPTIDEEPLQQAILQAINSVMAEKELLVDKITGALERELVPIPGVTMSLGDIQRRLEELDQQAGELLERSMESDFSDLAEQFQAITEETADLKVKRVKLEERNAHNPCPSRRIKEAAEILEQSSAQFTQWDESMIRQLIDTVKVVSADTIHVLLSCGTAVEQSMIKEP